MIRRRFLPIVLFAVALGSCATWRASTIGARQLIDQEHPTSIRVAREGGELLELREPRIVRDSIAVVSGACQRVAGRYRCPTTAMLAVEDVYVLQVRRPNRTATLLLVLSVATLGTLMAVVSQGLDSWSF